LNHRGQHGQKPAEGQADKFAVRTAAGVCLGLGIRRKLAGMFRRVTGRLLLVGLGFTFAAWLRAATPNIVLIFCDDLAYADIACFGAQGYRTPNLDRLAKQGTKFTSFYTAQPVCSAARASLLTGCYANRIGIHGALGPNSKTGLSAGETTLAEVLKGRGYATAIVGKWHLGRAPQFLPTRHGFDRYFGLPYSNDMWPNHPEAAKGTYPPLPLIQDEEVVQEMPDQRQLTTQYTERAVQFIEEQRGKPFFLYLAHSMPHVPLFVSDKFAGKTRRGLFGDVVSEIDWSVGRVLMALRRLKLEENTWVIFTSDNGPWLSYGDHAGSAGPFREGKGTVFEGGVREPCLMRWPGKIPAGRTSDTPLMTIDLLPTIAQVVEAPLPGHPIDGRNVWPLLAGQPGATNPHPAYYFYYNTGELQAVRSGDWKLLLPHTARSVSHQPKATGGIPVRYRALPVGLELYDLRADPGETRNLADENPAVLTRMLSLAEDARQDLGDSLTRRTGSGVRPPGKIP
jgi:arylsulfatase A-like enzyme